MNGSQIEEKLAQMAYDAEHMKDTEKSIFARETLLYIRDLKDRRDDEYFAKQSLQSYIDNHEEIWKSNAEIDKEIVRKETAKDMLSALYELCETRGVIQWDDIYFLVMRYKLREMF